MNHLSSRKIGILGGSFDPVHNGHLAIARAAYTDFDLDEVWFIPAGHSPNKNESGMTLPEYRAEMVALAVKPYPYFKMSTATAFNAYSFLGDKPSYKSINSKSSQYSEIE